MRAQRAPGALQAQRQQRAVPAAPRRVRRGRRGVVVMASNPRTARLRELLKGPTILKGPCCHDGLSARLIERAGFDFAFMSGFCTAGARLGAPDTGLISYAEMVDQGRYCHEATRSLPIIGDGDTGYGNALNVKRTVRGYAAAGFAGILIEDQVSPKSCGHVRGKRVVPRAEAVSRIRAAADARDEGADLLVLARTDARQAASLDEALWRAAAFADAGADLLFIDALASRDEMAAFCRLGGAAAGLPKMANMLEGGGKTPILPPEELQALGFKLVAYPLSLLGVSVRAMERALDGLRAGRVPGAAEMGTFVDLQMAVGFPEYYEEEARYALPLDSTSGGASASGPAAQRQQLAPPQQQAPGGGGGGQPFVSGFSAPQPPQAPAAAAVSDAGGDRDWQAAAGPVVEADQVVPPPDAAGVGLRPYGGGGRDAEADEAARQSRWDAFRRSRFFKVSIKDRRTGITKLETRIPAGFIGGLTALIPQVAGVNFEEMVEAAMGDRLDLSKPLLDYESGNDVITVYLE
ncbi:Dml [Scenedesmus sp. PABB004]|nr:Dml [Scenedesmus sp. PABB004]